MNPSLLLLLLTLQSTSTFTVLPSTTTRRTVFFLSDRNVETNGNGSSSNDGDDEDCDENGECEIDWDAMPTAAEIGSAAAMRKRLEMSWQLDEAKDDCNVDQPQSCGSEPCQECAGKGWKTCRFCRGTKMLFMPGSDPSFSDCKICQQGLECCRSCQGTGWVAGWTQLQETAH